MTTESELRALLAPDELRYEDIATGLGPDSIEPLHRIASGDDIMLASKAVYLASLLPGGADVVAQAADTDDPVLHAASAAALANLSGGEQVSVASTLLDTDDVAVQKVTLQSLGPSLPAELRDRVEQLARENPSDVVRGLSADRLKGN